MMAWSAWFQGWCLPRASRPSIYRYLGCMPCSTRSAEHELLFAAHRFPKGLMSAGSCARITGWPGRSARRSSHRQDRASTGTIRRPAGVRDRSRALVLAGQHHGAAVVGQALQEGAVGHFA